MKQFLSSHCLNKELFLKEKYYDFRNEFFERIVYILQNYGISYLKGAGTTLLIALVSTAIGCVIGFAVGIVQTIPVDKKRDGIGKRFCWDLSG